MEVFRFIPMQLNSRLDEVKRPSLMLNNWKSMNSMKKKEFLQNAEP
jgi:hypothetical protein